MVTMHLRSGADSKEILFVDKRPLEGTGDQWSVVVDQSAWWQQAATDIFIYSLNE